MSRFDQVDSILSNLTQNMEKIQQTANDAQTAAEEAKSMARNNQSEINELTDKIGKLEASLDDQINRNMRTTLVFNGINGTERSWNETSSILAQTINEIKPDIDCKNWIERAHRAKQNGNTSKPLPIIAKFCSWQHSEEIKSIIINHNKAENDRKKHLYVDQLQSKQLMERTNTAKLHRKQLKEEHLDWKMYICHPANLMCKEPGNLHYKSLKSF